MSKWTPGPWLVEPDGLDAFRIKSEDFGGVAYLHDPSAREIGVLDELAATARLIAAAPELAEALEVVTKRMEWDYTEGPCAEQSIGAALPPELYAARAILARINGESQ